jgi:hypothetical protein
MNPRRHAVEATPRRRGSARRYYATTALKDFGNAGPLT